jgi:hypothetical protein
LTAKQAFMKAADEALKVSKYWLDLAEKCDDYAERERFLMYAYKPSYLALTFSHWANDEEENGERT